MPQTSVRATDQTANCVAVRRALPTDAEPRLHQTVLFHGESSHPASLQPSRAKAVREAIPRWEVQTRSLGDPAKLEEHVDRQSDARPICLGLHEQGLSQEANVHIHRVSGRQKERMPLENRTYWPYLSCTECHPAGSSLCPTASSDEQRWRVRRWDSAQLLAGLR